jgi:hypothetical protein
MHPYRPPVGAFPSYNIEVVLKGREELPARLDGLVRLRMGGGHDKENLQVDAICDNVKALEGHY